MGPLWKTASNLCDASGPKKSSSNFDAQKEKGVTSQRLVTPFDSWSER